MKHSKNNSEIGDQFEVRAELQLNGMGWQVERHPYRNNPTYDLLGRDPDGRLVIIQVRERAHVQGNGTDIDTKTLEELSYYQRNGLDVYIFFALKKENISFMMSLATFILRFSGTDTRNRLQLYGSAKRLAQDLAALRNDPGVIWIRG